MAKINVQGLGIIEIQGDSPSAEEIKNIQKLINKKTLDTIPSFQEFKQKNPDAANIPSVNLAEQLYNSEYKNKGISETDFYQKFFPNIAKQKFEEADQIIVSPEDMMLGKTELDYVSFKPTTADIAEQAGVSVNDPATSNARFAASLGYNQNQKILAVKNTMSKLFKQDIDVRVGPNTGELEYFNPRTNSYALVDKPGLDFGDIADLGGDAMVLIPDLAATVFATVKTGGFIPAGIAAGAVAAGIGEFMRLKLGQKLYDINMDLSDMDLLSEALKTAGISAGAGVLGVGAAKIIKGATNILKGRIFGNVDEGVKLAESTKVKEAKEVSDAINQKLEDAGIKSKLKYTLAEAADDKDLLSIQKSFEDVRRLGYTKEFSEASLEKANALNSYFKLLKDKFGSATGSTYDTGKDIAKVLDERNTDVIKNLIKKQEASEELLTKAVFRLPDGNVKTTGIEFQNIIKKLSKDYKDKVKEAAEQLDGVTSLKSINTKEIANAINKLSDQQKKNFINVAEAENLFKKEFLEILENPNATIPLANARETISTLGSLIRKSEKGLAAGDDVEVGALKLLKNAFTNQVKKDAGPEYLNELQRFNDLVIRNKELLNNDIIAKITNREVGNVLKIGDEAIFETTFKKGVNSEKVARQVHDVISQSPDAMNAYKNSIFDFYKSKVLNEVGKPNLVKHNAFMKDYEKVLKVFFNKSEFNQIKRIGGLQKNIERTNKLFDNVTKELNRSFEGKLLNNSPQEIFNKIYKPGNIGEIKTLKKILQKNPEIYKKFQRDVLTDLNERVFTRSKNLSLDKVLDADAFNKYLNGGGGERGYKTALKEIFGESYVKDLETLNKALLIASRKAPAAQQGVVGSALTDLIRARLGQFTLAGRLFTAGRRIFTAASNRVIARALLDPNSLKDLLALKNLKTGSKQAAVILAKLGGSIFITLPDDGAPIPPKSSIEKTSSFPNLFREREKSFDFFPSKDPKIDLSMMPSMIEPMKSPNIDTTLLAQAQPKGEGIMQNLSATERALLDPSEQVIAART
jgi:hypothetical protein